MRKTRLLLKLIFHILFWPTGILLTLAIAWTNYKDDLTTYLVTSAAEDYGLQLTIGDLELEVVTTFPKLRLSLQSVSVNNGLTEIVAAERLSFTLDLKDLYQSKYIVETLYLKDAEITFQEDKNGNLLLLPQDSTRPSPPSNERPAIAFQLKEINIANSTVTYHGRNNTQAQVHIEEAVGAYHLHNREQKIVLKSAMNLGALQNTGVDWLGNKSIDFSTEVLISDSLQTFRSNHLKLTINGVPIEGNVLVSLARNAYALDVSTISASVTNLSALLPRELSKELSRWAGNGTLTIAANIDGQGNAYTFRCSSKAEQASIADPEQRFQATNLSFKAHLSGNHHGEVKASVKDLTGLVNGHPIVMDFFYEKEKTGKENLELAGSASLTLASLKSFIKPYAIDTTLGELDFNLDLRAKFRGKEIILDGNGECSLDGVRVISSSRNLSLTNLGGDLVFSNNSIAINQLSGILNGNQLELTGYLSHINAYPLEPFYANIQLSADSLSYAAFTNLQITETSEKKESSNSNTLPNMSIDISTKVLQWDSLTFKRVYLNTSTHLNELAIDSFSFTWRQSKAYGQILISEIFTPKPSILAHLTWKELNLNDALASFGNFGQREITNENLWGMCSGKLDLFAKMETPKKLALSSLNMEADILIEEGRLKNYIPTEQLSKFLDEAALKDLRFQRISNSFWIRMDTLFVPTMEINSNALNLEIGGWSNLKNDSLNYGIKIPLRNWQKEDKDTRFGKIDPGSLNNGNLFLILSGTPSKPVVSFDKKRSLQRLKEQWKQEKENFKQLFKRNN